MGIPNTLPMHRAGQQLRSCRDGPVALRVLDLRTRKFYALSYGGSSEVSSLPSSIHAKLSPTSPMNSTKTARSTADKKKEDPKLGTQDLEDIEDSFLARFFKNKLGSPWISKKMNKLLKNKTDEE
jgi:hypothetical protein